MQPQTDSSKTTADQYDYSSFSLPVTAAERQAFKERDGGSDGTQQYWVIALVGAVFGGIASLVFVGSVLGSMGASAETIMAGGFLMWVALTALSVMGVRWLGRKRQDKLVRLDRFASVNGMEFKHDRTNAGYNGMIFDEGHSQVLNEALVLPDGSEVGNYTYVTGSGKNRSVHTYSFVRVPLTRALPHMVLDAKSNNLFGRISNLTDTFDKSQTLSLEGDFDDHFTLYAPRQYERDALYVFTPDVMAALIDNGSDYDMEAIDKELYVYHGGHFDLTDGQQMNRLFRIVDAITGELHDQTKRYADERVPDRSMNVVAPEGARLKHGINWIATISLILVIGYQIFETFFIQSTNSYAWFIAFSVAISIVILVVMIKSTRRS